MYQYAKIGFRNRYGFTPRALIDESEYDVSFRKCFVGTDVYVKGLCFYSSLGGIKCDHEKAFECFLTSAREGNMFAQHDLGLCYSWANGCNRNDGEAFNWFLKAAKQGFFSSQMRVAEALYYGTGTFHDLNGSWEWFKKCEGHGKDIEWYLEREEFKNFDLHDNCRDSLICFLAIRKFKKNECGDLGRLPYDVVKLIAKDLWRLKNEDCWKNK